MYQIYFIFEWHCTCFGRSFRPSPAVQDCTYSNQTDTADCLLVSRQQCLFDICLLLYVQCWTADDRQKDRQRHVQCHSKIKHIWYIGASGWFYCRNNIIPLSNQTSCQTTHHTQPLIWVCAKKCTIKQDYSSKWQKVNIIIIIIIIIISKTKKQ